MLKIGIPEVSTITLTKFEQFGFASKMQMEHTARDNQHDRITNAIEINKQAYGVNTCLGTTLQVVPRQVFTPYSRLLISTAFVVSRVGFLGVDGVWNGKPCRHQEPVPLIILSIRFSY